MPTFPCRFCQHANPASAKFCNECGSGLHLQPCAHCDAINDRHAAQCHHCGVALAAAPSEPARDASEQDAVPTLVDEVTLPAAGVSADPRTSVDRAFEVLERDLATLDRTRTAARGGGGASWGIATQHQENAAGSVHDLAAVRLQPFWRVRASRPRARTLAATVAAGVAIALAAAGYLHTLPHGADAGGVVATVTQPVREIASPSRVDVPTSAPGPHSAPPSVPQGDTSSARSPDSAPASVRQGDSSITSTPSTVEADARGGAAATSVATVPAMPNADVSPPASAVMAKQDDPIPAPAVGANQDEPTPPAAVGTAAAPAAMAQADEPAAPSAGRAATAKPRRARAYTPRTLAVSPQDSVPTSAAPGFDAVSPAPVASPCTAGVAALGLCARR